MFNRGLNMFQKRGGEKNRDLFILSFIRCNHETRKFFSYKANISGKLRQI